MMTKWTTLTRKLLSAKRNWIGVRKYLWDALWHGLWMDSKHMERYDRISERQAMQLVKYLKSK